MRAPKFFIRLFLCTLSLTGLLLTGCSEDDGPTGPVAPSGPTILILGDGKTEAHVSSTLRAAGFHVRDGGLFHEFRGEGLEDADAVVLLAGFDYNHDMDDRGEAALVDFVGRGGGLLSTEWLSFSISSSGYHQLLRALLPVSYAGSYGAGSETYTVMLDHPVTENLPATFSTGGENQFSSVGPRTGATQLVRGNRSGAAVVTWTKGGRVVSWNMAGEYGGEDVWNPEMDQLLIDATGFVGRR